MTTFPSKPLSLEDLENKVEQLHHVINGNPHTDTIGIRSRVKAIEDLVDEIRKERIRNRWILYGIGIGFGLAQASILTILVQVLDVLTSTGLP